MKIRIMSDLHLEGNSFVYEYIGEDVLILAGDIHTRNRLHVLLNDIPNSVKVVFVAGNHEYYHSDFTLVNQYFESLKEFYSNFIWLNNNSVDINGIGFYGGTMFTDFELYGNKDKAVDCAANRIYDFNGLIIEDGLPWTYKNHIKKHELFKRGLDEFIQMPEYDTKIVVSHFMPSAKCINTRYLGSNTNPFFVSDMEYAMTYKGYWIAGHGHSCMNKTVNDVGIIMNPKGYAYENFDFNPNLMIEV